MLTTEFNRTLGTIHASSEIPSIWDRIEAAKKFFGLPYKPKPNFQATNQNSPAIPPKPLSWNVEYITKAAEATEKALDEIVSAPLTKTIRPTTKERIIEIVGNAGRYQRLTASDIAAKLPDINHKGVTSRISELVKSGHLSYTGKIYVDGRYVNGYKLGGS